jgi:hypothetical protein
MQYKIDFKGNDENRVGADAVDDDIARSIR